MNTTIVAGQGTGMLGVFDSFQVRNEEKISQSDIRFCENQTEALNQTLLQLKGWYDIFYKSAQTLTGDNRVKFQKNGSAKFEKTHMNSVMALQPYKEFEFLPVDDINKIVENRRKAIEKFAGNIIRYFNKTYDLTVPVPEIDKENLALEFQPEYMTYVDTVIAHLGGRSFRETAEDELINKFHKTVHRYDRHALPELKSKSIIFPNLFYFDNFNLQYNRYEIRWEQEAHISNLCSGLAFYAHDRLNGDSGIIYGYDRNNVNITDWYPLSTSPAEYLKFYKNGRLDVKFKDAASAEECFRKLKLNEL
jgi:hypothetical protein